MGGNVTCHSVDIDASSGESLNASSHSVDIGSSVLPDTVLDNVEGLEVSNALAIAVSEASESLLVDLLDSLEVSGNVAFGSLLAVEDEVEGVLDVFLAGTELRAEGGNVSGGLGIGLLEGGLINVAGEHSVLDSTVLGGETGDLGACAGAVLSGVLIAESAGTMDLGVGQEALLGKDTGLVLDLEGAGLLLLPPGALLVNSGVEAFNDNTALLAVFAVESVGVDICSSIGRILNVKVGVGVEAAAAPVAGVVELACVLGETDGCPFLLLLVGASAASELTVNNETPGRAAVSGSTAVLGGGGNATSVAVRLGDGSSGEECQ